MKFEVLAQYFEKIEETSSRNKMISIMSDLFTEIDEEIIDIAAYFLTGDIAADYRDVKVGLGEEMTKASVAMASNVDESEVESKMKELGDLGDGAAYFYGRRHELYQDELKTGTNLTVDEVHQGLIAIANASGSGSQEEKKRILASLLAASNDLERRYIVRLALGTMRLGAGDMTVLDGLAEAFLGSKDKREPLEHAYNVSSDIGHVAEVLAKSGLDGIKRMRVAINRPLRPMLAQRVDSLTTLMEKIGSEVIAAEEKYDGERIQAHKDGDKTRLYSRRLNEVTGQFPDIVQYVQDHTSAESVILDGEAVAYDFEKEEYYPFQRIMNRRRKYDVEEYAEKIPVQYVVFDILYKNGKSLLTKLYPERRNNLERTVNETAKMKIAGRVTSSKLEAIDEFFQECLDRGLEGVVCKSCGDNSRYRAGAREWSWIKWKPSYASDLSDTLDLVIIGAYAGKGARAGTYGSLLCATYNKEEAVFETVCKLGSGFTDEVLENLPDKLEDAKTDSRPARISATKDIEPDYWFYPKYVAEILSSEITKSPVHTCDGDGDRGLSLRFPRFQNWRPDKSPTDATTTSEIVTMYENQEA
ncbi:ATP-dependent DNA ligase [Candidatus Thorarchaeota archaeon]|nr:MAG: ATP-dependent DNA ligase [Candidatus Thorarchaeota archaeon]